MIGNWPHWYVMLDIIYIHMFPNDCALNKDLCNVGIIFEMLDGVISRWRGTIRCVHEICDISKIKQ